VLHSEYPMGTERQACPPHCEFSEQCSRSVCCATTRRICSTPRGRLLQARAPRPLRVRGRLSVLRRRREKSHHLRGSNESHISRCVPKSCLRWFSVSETARLCMLCSLQCISNRHVDPE